MADPGSGFSDNTILASPAKYPLFPFLGTEPFPLLLSGIRFHPKLPGSDRAPCVQLCRKRLQQAQLTVPATLWSWRKDQVLFSASSPRLWRFLLLGGLQADPKYSLQQPEKSPLPPPPPVSAAPQSPALDLNAEFSIVENGSDSQVCARPQPPFSTCFSHPRWQNHLAFNTAPTTAPNWDPAWCPPCTHCRGSRQELEVPWGHICHLLL